MEYLQLGKTHLKVSRIGLGGLAFGGHYGVVEKKAVIQTIRYAIENGITLFDTASWYGGGRAEELLGEAIEGKREHIILAGKVGIGVSGTPPVSSGEQVSEIVRQVEASLKRLRTEYIDLCQVYLPEPVVSAEDFMAAMEQLRQAGKILSAGLYDADVSLTRGAVKNGELATVQSSYNILNRNIEKEIVPFCRAARIGMLACEPLCRGLLLGKFRRNSAFDLDDLRSDDKRFKGNQYNRNLETVNRLRTLAAQEKLTLMQSTLGWVLQNPSITVAICGAKTPGQLREILVGAETQLNPEQIIAIDQIVGEEKYQKPE